MIRQLTRMWLRIFVKQPFRITGQEKFIANLKPSPFDIRDEEYELAYAFVDGGEPSSVSLIEHCPKIKQQGKIGSCGSHAYCTAMEIIVAAQRGKEKVVPLSELFHYYVVRDLLYDNTLPKDAGQHLRNGAKVCTAMGVSPEKLCKYDVYKYNESPSPFAYSFAKLFKIKSYHRCWTNKSIKQALIEQRPVVAGFRINEGWITSKRDIVNSGKSLGGHAVCIIGYDDEYRNQDGTLGCFIFANSWGVRWGESGFGRISYVLAFDTMMEAWTITLS